MKLSSVKSTCTQNEKRLPWVTPGNGPGNFQSGAPRVKEQPVSRAVVLAAAMGGWVEKVACVPDELTKEPRMWSGRGREEGRRGGVDVFVAASRVLVRFFDRSYADTQLFYLVLRAGCQYLGKTDIVLRTGCRRYMIFGPPDKIHVGLSSVTPTVPVLALRFGRSRVLRSGL